MAKTAPPPPGGKTHLTVRPDKNGWYRFGAVSDTHLGSKHYREDVLGDLYDFFEKGGIEHVFHGGNWIEGVAPFNRYDLAIHTWTDQIQFFIAKYPQRKGITTFYVTGDDHEGWIARREQFNIGNHLQSEAMANGRDDLVHLGYIEADVEVSRTGGRKGTVIRVQHGGGGSSYAISYRPQKIAESWQGGEKPDILILGHYHKLGYFNVRNVHIVMPGCTEDQSTFMRKQSIEAHVGGVMVEVRLDSRNTITDFRTHFKTYYDRRYYQSLKHDIGR